MATIATAPSDVITQFATALHEGRVDDALSLYEDDAVFVPEPGAQPIAGRAPIRAALAQFAALKPTMTNSIQKVVTTGEVAVVHSAWRLRGTAPDGRPVEMGDTSADVMRRRPDGSWGILIDDPWSR
jgi:uncharacterized protein (TIGR02246 family)